MGGNGAERRKEGRVNGSLEVEKFAFDHLHEFLFYDIKERAVGISGILFGGSMGGGSV